MAFSSSGGINVLNCLTLFPLKSIWTLFLLRIGGPDSCRGFARRLLCSQLGSRGLYRPACCSCMEGSLDRVRRLRRYRIKVSMNEKRLLPDTPISAKRASGSAVRQRIMILVRREILRLITGSPIARASIPASITFLVLNIPPNNVPPSSIKFGGII